jgi:hypothetical protein
MNSPPSSRHARRAGCSIRAVARHAGRGAAHPLAASGADKGRASGATTGEATTGEATTSGATTSEATTSDAAAGDAAAGDAAAGAAAPAGPTRGLAVPAAGPGPHDRAQRERTERERLVARGNQFAPRGASSAQHRMRWPGGRAVGPVRSREFELESFGNSRQDSNAGSG